MLSTEFNTSMNLNSTMNVSLNEVAGNANLVGRLVQQNDQKFNNLPFLNESLIRKLQFIDSKINIVENTDCNNNDLMMNNFQHESLESKLKMLLDSHGKNQMHMEIVHFENGNLKDEVKMLNGELSKLKIELNNSKKKTVK